MPDVISRDKEEHKGALSLSYEGRERVRGDSGEGRKRIREKGTEGSRKNERQNVRGENMGESINKGDETKTSH